jgi:membrane protease YdiL (CAAX protease family)
MVVLERLALFARNPERFDARARPNHGVWLLAVLTVVWGVMMRQFGDREIYTLVGSYALCVSAVVLVFYRRQARAWFRLRVRDVLTGVLVGSAMTALTYPIYRLAVALLPRLEPVVSGLYRSSHKGPLSLAVLWVLLIIAAEELLFRGAWLLALEGYMSKGAALGLSVLLYAGAQAFSGSLIVGLLALCCGALWSLERVWTGSLIAPLLSHMIWTPVVILLYPVVP